MSEEAANWLALLLPLDNDVRREIVVELLKSLGQASSDIRFDCRKCGCSVPADKRNQVGVCLFCEELGDQHVHDVYHKKDDRGTYCSRCDDVWDCYLCRGLSEVVDGIPDTYVDQCCHCRRYYLSNGCLMRRF